MGLLKWDRGVLEMELKISRERNDENRKNEWSNKIIDNNSRFQEKEINIRDGIEIFKRKK